MVIFHPSMLHTLYGVALFLVVVSVALRLVRQTTFIGKIIQQVNAWWGIFALLSLCLVRPVFGIPLLYLLLIGLSWRELVSHCQNTGLHWMHGGLSLLIAQAGLGFAAPSMSLLALPAISIGLLTVKRYIPPPTRWPLTALLVAGYGFHFLLLLTHALIDTAIGSANLLLYLFVITALNDVAQFVIGTLFGRHKLAPRISPLKSWQGLIGGCIVSSSLSMLLAPALGLFSLPQALLAGISISLVGLLGDLAFSRVKRSLKIKDFSNLIPGHGGLLDRADSLVFTAPWLYAVFFMLHNRI